MIIILSLTVKIFLTGAINTMFVIMVESYPNTIKNFGYSINTAVGKIGALIVTFLVEIMNSRDINIMFTCFGLINFILFFKIKETRGRPLEADIPELMEVN